MGIGPVNLPHGLHGCWTEEISPDLAQLQNAKVLLNLYMRKSKEWNQMDGAFSGMGIGQFFGQRESTGGDAKSDSRRTAHRVAWSSQTETSPRLELRASRSIDGWCIAIGSELGSAHCPVPTLVVF